MKWGLVGRAAFLSVLVVAASARAATEVQPYLVSVDGAVVVRPLWSVGDTLPETSDPSLSYRMVGIPDGLGLVRNTDGTRTLYMNHEFRSDISTEPVVGQPLQRGAFVSKLSFSSTGELLSGERAFDTVYDENTLVGPAAQADNQTPAFARFCSGMIAGKAQGFDRTMFLTNEEADAPGAFDPRGGSTVAIFNNEAHALPKLGHFSKEQSLIMSGTGKRTVIIMLEDGPVTPDSQVYMYVGRKSKTGTALARNGLDNGKLYVMGPITSEVNDEATFTQGSIDVVWRQITGAEAMSDVELEAAADAMKGFSFVRIEDGALDLHHPNELFFATTGAPDTGNQLGRLYHLSLDPYDPLGLGKLTLVVDSEAMHNAGTPVPLAPDNMGINKRYLMVQEGGNGPSKVILGEQGRDNSVWRYDLKVGKRHTKLDVASGVRIAQVNTPGRDGASVPPGTWESSGAIPAGNLLASGTWLMTVQTFPPTVEPMPNTFRDGQLVGVYPASN